MKSERVFRRKLADSWRGVDSDALQSLDSVEKAVSAMRTDSACQRLVQEGAPEVDEFLGIVDARVKAAAALSEEVGQSLGTSSVLERKGWGERAREILNETEHDSRVLDWLNRFYVPETAGFPIPERRERGTELTFERFKEGNPRGVFGPDSVDTILEIWKEREGDALATLGRFNKLQKEVNATVRHVNFMIGQSAGDEAGAFLVGAVVGRVTAKR